MDVHSTEQRRRNMQAIRSKGTKEELTLAKALWHRGHRYRKNLKTVFGTPDLVFQRNQLAIFVDSEYFHGKDWESQKFRIKSNQAFWWNKIERNIQRDQLVNQVLRSKGWIVLRFWSLDIRKNLGSCIELIESKLVS